MDMSFRDKFVQQWAKYFPSSPLPICFYYTNDTDRHRPLPPPKGHVCLIGQLARVRKGETLAMNVDSLGCFGGKRYLGFSTETMPNFEYFLSCGIEGKLEGERYKKTPQVVLETFKHQPEFRAPAKMIVFKRWDKLDENDQPEVVIFFGIPDVLSGLFTLAGFDETDPNAVISPFAAGCGTIVQWPWMEGQSQQRRCVIGMFDVSARPFVGSDTISFAAPMEKFTQMVNDMEESFLITASWQKVRRRIGSDAGSEAKGD